MIEQLILLVIFLAALGYLGRRLYISFRGKKRCAKGCGCSEVELKKLTGNGGSK